MEDSSTITQFIKHLDESLDTIEPKIQELTSESFEDRLNSASDDAERIKLANGYAYILVSLSFAYLKSQGVDTSKHPIMADLARVKSYIGRAKAIEKNASEPRNTDSAAAKRFIESALNSGTGNSTVIRGTPQPAISSVSFQGTHTKFEDIAKDDDGSDTDSKTTKQTVKQRAHKLPKSDNRVKKPKNSKTRSPKHESK